MSDFFIDVIYVAEHRDDTLKKNSERNEKEEAKECHEQGRFSIAKLDFRRRASLAEIELPRARYEGAIVYVLDEGNRDRRGTIMQR